MNQNEEAHKMAIPPDVVTAWIHNNINLKRTAMAYVVFGVIVLPFGWYFTAISMGVLAAVCMALHPFIHGWVHCFVAYSLLSDKHTVELTEKEK